MANVEVVGEYHTDGSGPRYLKRSIDKMSPDQAKNTIIYMEYSLVMNGVIQAYYRGEISDAELKTALMGHSFAFARENGALEFETIKAAKEKGIPVVAYDTRDTIDGAFNGVTAFDRIRERKQQMRENELTEYTQKIAEAKSPEEKAKLAAERDARMAEIDKSLELLERYKDDPLVVKLDQTVRDTMTNDAFAGQGFAAAKAEVTAALIVTETQEAYRRNNGIVLIGEAHLAGSMVNRFKDYNQIGYAGAFDEALESQGAKVKLVSLRSKAEGFLDDPKDPKAFRLAEKFDEYVILGEDGKERRFKTIDDLSTVVLNESDEKTKAQLVFGVKQIGMAGPQEGLPDAAHSPFAGLIDPKLMSKIRASVDLSDTVGNSIPQKVASKQTDGPALG